LAKKRQEGTVSNGPKNKRKENMKLRNTNPTNKSEVNYIYMVLRNVYVK